MNFALLSKVYAVWRLLFKSSPGKVKQQTPGCTKFSLGSTEHSPLFLGRGALANWFNPTARKQGHKKEERIYK